MNANLTTRLGILATALLTATAAACTAGTSARSGSTTSPSGGDAWRPTGELVYSSQPADPGGTEFVLPTLASGRADGAARRDRARAAVAAPGGFPRAPPRAGGRGPGSDRRDLALAAYAATWSYDGSRLLAVGIPLHPGEVFPARPAVVTADGRVLRLFRLPGLPDEVDNCRWTPDEGAIVCAAGGVVVIDPGTGEVTRLTTGHDQVWDVSGDGLIAYVHQRGADDHSEDAELFTIHVDGTGRRRLTDYGVLDGTFDDSGGSWLPDGSAIVAATAAGALVSVDAATGALTAIPIDEALRAGHPDVSPDGTEIAFQSPPAAGSDLYVTRIGGGEVVRVTESAADERRADWRPRP